MACPPSEKCARGGMAEEAAHAERPLENWHSSNAFAAYAPYCGGRGLFPSHASAQHLLETDKQRASRRSTSRRGVMGKQLFVQARLKTGAEPARQRKKPSISYQDHDVAY